MPQLLATSHNNPTLVDGSCSANAADMHMTPPHPPSGLKRDGALADSAFCSVGLLPSELRLSPAAVMDEAREAALDRGESGWSQLRSACRGSCPAESSCRREGLVDRGRVG